MATKDTLRREVAYNIVYYGSAFSGKMTNLQFLYNKIPPRSRGELMSEATETDRCLYFDFRSESLGKVDGLSVNFRLLTTHGQMVGDTVRKRVFRDVDGFVLVADSQLSRMNQNAKALQDLGESFAGEGRELDDIPIVVQYNKRDLPSIAPIRELHDMLNQRDCPQFQAVAVNGAGVFDTLGAVCRMVLDKARQEAFGSLKDNRASDRSLCAAKHGNSN